MVGKLTKVSCRGRLVQDKATKKPKLNCRNWECGVVIPIPTSFESLSAPTDLQAKFQRDSQISKTADHLDIFANTVPVPMRQSPRPMGSAKPWFNEG